MMHPFKLARQFAGAMEIPVIDGSMAILELCQEKRVHAQLLGHLFPSETDAIPFQCKKFTFIKFS